MGEGQALGRHAGGPRLGHAQRQRGGFGGAALASMMRVRSADICTATCSSVGVMLGLVRVNGRQRESSGVQGWKALWVQRWGRGAEARLRGLRAANKTQRSGSG